MAILTVVQLRQSVKFPTGVDADAALQLLLDATEVEIVRVAGASGSVTELGDGGDGYLILGRPITSVTTITEDIDGTPLVLSADDYRFTVGGYVLHRLSTGTNSRNSWYGKVQAIYVAEDDSGLRASVQLDLVRLGLNVEPGLTARTIGDWSETFATGDLVGQRDAVLGRLVDGPSMVVIG